MSESDSNSERSYDSDDSEYNLSLATSTLAIYEVKDDGNLGDNNGATGPHYHV